MLYIIITFITSFSLGFALSCVVCMKMGYNTPKLTESLSQVKNKAIGLVVKDKVTFSSPSKKQANQQFLKELDN